MVESGGEAIVSGTALVSDMSFLEITSVGGGAALRASGGYLVTWGSYGAERTAPSIRQKAKVSSG
jgi:hypothetical protein